MFRGTHQDWPPHCKWLALQLDADVRRLVRDATSVEYQILAAQIKGLKNVGVSYPASTLRLWALMCGHETSVDQPFENGTRM